jgi:uncharacterized protein YegP (UPF0339 family)
MNTWRKEIVDNRVTHQLHVRIEHLIVEKDNGRWRWVALDGDGEAVANGNRYYTKADAQLAATTWAYTRALDLHNKTAEETL